MSLRAFLYKTQPRASAVGYTLWGKPNKRLLRLLLNEDRFYESYVTIYGAVRRRVYTKAKAIYVDPPYLRGPVFLYGAQLSQTPITVYLNLDSRCVKQGEVEKAIELMVEGAYSMYISTPLTNQRMLSLYRDKVYKILNELGVGLKMVYPSYSLVVGRSRIFKDSPISLWSSEVLAALMTELVAGKDRVEVVNTGCTDVIPQVLEEFSEIYMEHLSRDVVSLLVRKGLVSEDRAKQYLGAG